jgi:tetratricopeptide (TPR) repeat protein
MTQRHRSILAGLGLMALTLAVYLPATRCGFIWDDEAYVTNNRALRSLEGLWSIWTQPRSIPQYYPLVHTTFWIEYGLWGDSPAGYHVTNVVLHAIGAVLVWRVLKRLAVPGAYLAGALFAVHPVCVESVAWVTERKNVLSTVLYLASGLAYLHYALPALHQAEGRRPGPAGQKPRQPTARPRPQRLYALSLGLFLLALLSKTVACTLPAALLVVLWWKKGRVGRRDLAALAPFAAIGLLLGLVTVYLERAHVGAVGQEWELTPVQRLLLAGRALWFYAGKLAWPAHLTFIYPRWDIDPATGWQWLFPAGVLVVMAALWLARRILGGGALAAVLVFAGTLAPALGLFNVYPMRYSYVADHFQYLATIALLALAAAACARVAGRLGRRARPAAIAAAALVLAALGVLTYRQQAIYTDLQTLWAATLKANPRAWMAHTNLANIFQEQGRYAEALEHYRAVVELYPWEAKGHNNLGSALLVQGDLTGAMEHCREALRLKPDYAESYVTLCKALLATGALEEAEAAFRQAAALSPELARNQPALRAILIDHDRHRQALWLVGYGDTRSSQRLLEQSADVYRQAIACEPGLVDAHVKLGATLSRLGRQAEALPVFEQAVKLDPDCAPALNGAAWILATYLDLQVRDPRRALEWATRAADLTGREDPNVLDTLAAAHAAGGDFATAAVVAKEAMALAELAGSPQTAEIQLRVDYYQQHVSQAGAAAANRGQ